MKAVTHYLKATSLIPNSKHPLLIYRGVFTGKNAPEIESAFTANGWQPQWRYSMFHKSHYHSTTHEALGVFQGEADLLFGVADSEMTEGKEVKETVQAGDVIVIPAGVAHRALEDRGGFQMVGAYPKGSEQWDMCYGGEAVKELAVPPDPLGGSGGLAELWA